MRSVKEEAYHHETGSGPYADLFGGVVPDVHDPADDDAYENKAYSPCLPPHEE